MNGEESDCNSCLDEELEVYQKRREKIKENNSLYRFILQTRISTCNMIGITNAIKKRRF